jgi:alpha-tubulin suppressor-like RCC1 family protein
MKRFRTPVRICLALTLGFSAMSAIFTSAGQAVVPSTLSAWGFNDSGLLGDGTTTSRSTPTVIGSSTWTAIAQGTNVSAAIKSDGTLWTWGRNEDGTLGDGTTTSRQAPAQLGSATWIAVAVSNHVLAIQADGSLWAWGRNDSGQLGDGTTTRRLSPFRIGTATWSSVSVHGPRSVAIRSDGTLFRWGSISNPPWSYTTPTQVDKQLWRAVSVGGGHVLAAMGQQLIAQPRC